MSRTPKEYIVLVLKGMAMGAADVVPGVSGGTIAFISGIYEELLSSISSLNLGLVNTLKKEGVAAAWKQANGSFLLSLFTGIIVSVLSLAKVLKWLLENEPVILWSFFFGLILASILYIGKQIKNWNFITISVLIIGVVNAYYITTLNPMVTENSSLWYLFLSGSLAICAMILPGISGAFILVLLGAYAPILEAVNNKDLLKIGVVALGALAGLLSFSRILKWLFNSFNNLTLAALTGFIIGSLNKIWPWKETTLWRTNSHGEQVPFQQLSISPFSYEGDPQLAFAITAAIIGFLLIIVLEKIAVNNK